MSPDILNNINGCIGDMVTYTRIGENLIPLKLYICNIKIAGLGRNFYPVKSFGYGGTLYDYH